MATHLILDCYIMDEHPQETMKKLGIEYLYAKPLAIASEWLFFCCENIPNPLPKRLAALGDIDPSLYFNKEIADKIRDHDKSI